MKWFWPPEVLWSTSRDTPSESGVGLRVRRASVLLFVLFLSGRLGDGERDTDREEEELELLRLALYDF